MVDCENCVHFSVCSRLGGCNFEDCSDFKEAVGNKHVVNLPCEIGDILYFISHFSGKLETDKVRYFTVTRNGVKPVLEIHNSTFLDYYEFNKNVFLSETEARAALTKEVINV
jgi:hypothetical protein